MKIIQAVTGACLILSGGAAAAQNWTPGSEIAGQTVQVDTNGVVNNITFNADGTATITTPSGKAIPANWTAAGKQLCLLSGGQSECFPYAQAFQAGQPVTLTSSCNATSRWLASSVNQPPSQRPAGERG